MSEDLEALRRRLEATYMRLEGASSGHGAQTWLARLARLDPRTVRRALAGDIPPDRVEAALDLIDAGQRAGPPRTVVQWKQIEAGQYEAEDRATREYLCTVYQQDDGKWAIADDGGDHPELKPRGTLRAAKAAAEDYWKEGG